jgi:hypothetical protein
VRLRELRKKTSELPGLGRLEVPRGKYNGPSGQVLAARYLAPLGVERSTCWITDLHDTYFVSKGNEDAIRERYMPRSSRIGGVLPVQFPKRPPLNKPSPERLRVLRDEFFQANPEWVITLGNDPIGPILGSEARKLEFKRYGEPFTAKVFGHPVKVLCLCHPRQAAGLGASSRKWYQQHRQWMEHMGASGGLSGLRP